MKITAQIENADKLESFPPQVRAGLDQAERQTVLRLIQLGGAALRKFLSGVDRNVRTGDLRRFVDSSNPPTRDARGWLGRFGYGQGATSRYAPILEYGGTIVPKHAKVLSIPVGNALTPTGRKRFASPLDVAGGFWFSPRSTPLFAVSTGSGKGRRLEVLFVGKTRVTITGKFSARKAAAEAQSKAGDVLSQEIQRALVSATRA